MQESSSQPKDKYIEIIRPPSLGPGPISEPVTYRVYNTTHNFLAKDWDRGVAVFTVGQLWQFKNSLWQEPV